MSVRGTSSLNAHMEGGMAAELDTRGSPRHRPGHRSRSGAGFLMAVLSMATAGCRSSPAPPWTPGDRAEPRGVAEAALAATLPEGPVQMAFSFRLREADLRFQGRGVARIEPPYRVRLDLFSNRGETLFQGALVEGELRIPDWAPREMAPPPGLLWAALGVFRPDPGWELTGSRSERDGTVSLRYETGEGEELRFRIRESRLVRAELLRGGRLVEEVTLSLDRESGTVTETVYRNRGEFVELSFHLQSSETVAFFPPHIWDPGR
jgi:hypothetical protein